MKRSSSEELNKIVSDWNAAKLDHLTANLLLIQLATKLPAEIIIQALDEIMLGNLKAEIDRAPKEEVEWSSFTFVSNCGDRGGEAMKQWYKAGVLVLQRYWSDPR